jgi:hypothetical protein
MKPRDVFEAILRAMAICVCLAGIMNLLHLVTELLGLPVQTRLSIGEELIGIAAWIILGTALLALTPLIARALYGRND